MKIVILESDTLGTDIDLSAFHSLGEVETYPLTPIQLVPERIEEAEVVLVNKIPMNESTLKDAKNLKLIAITATGTNIVDFDYTEKRGIQVCNVAGYSTNTVAQHTFSLLFYLMEKLAYYDNYVKGGAYCESPMFTHLGKNFNELDGKTWGIIGLGAIGRKVASIAEAFGCNVQYYSTSGKNTTTDYKQVELKELLATSDIISIHAPLTPATHHLLNLEAFQQMKPSAYLVNVGRGPIVNEEDLLFALENNLIAGAALDVLSEEPMKKDNPLIKMKDSNKLIITPHIAWASVEARQRLVRQVFENVKKFIDTRK